MKSAKEIFKIEYGNSKNFMTPNILKVGKINHNLAFELSRGTGFKNEEIFDSTDQGDKLEIQSIRNVLESNGKMIVKNITKKRIFEAIYNLSEKQRKILLAGGALNYKISPWWPSGVPACLQPGTSGAE